MLAHSDSKEARRREARKTLREMKSLALEVSAAWKSPKSAIEILREERA